MSSSQSLGGIGSGLLFRYSIQQILTTPGSLHTMPFEDEDIVIEFVDLCGWRPRLWVGLPRFVRFDVLWFLCHKFCSEFRADLVDLPQFGHNLNFIFTRSIEDNGFLARSRSG